MIFYKTEVDTDHKLSNYLKITGIINNMCRAQKTLNKTKLKLYSTLVLTGLLIKLDSKLPKRAEINQEVRQGCPLSPVLFHVCLDEIRVKTGSFKQETQEE